MEENNYNNNQQPVYGQPQERPVDNLTLDPYGNQADINQAREEVTAANAIFGAPAMENPQPVQPEQPLPIYGQAPQYESAQPEQPEQPLPVYGQAPQQPQYDAQPQYQQAPQYQQPQYQQPQYQQPQYQQAPQQPYQAPIAPQPMTPGMGEPKSKMAAGLLGIFLGAFGVHNFYLGYTGKALAQLLISVLSCGTLAVVSEIWGLIEGIQILTGSIATDAKGIPMKD